MLHGYKVAKDPFSTLFVTVRLFFGSFSHQINSCEEFSKKKAFFEDTGQGAASDFFDLLKQAVDQRRSCQVFSGQTRMRRD